MSTCCPGEQGQTRMLIEPMRAALGSRCGSPKLLQNTRAHFIDPIRRLLPIRCAATGSIACGVVLLERPLKMIWKLTEQCLISRIPPAAGNRFGAVSLIIINMLYKLYSALYYRYLSSVSSISVSAYQSCIHRKHIDTCRYAPNSVKVILELQTWIEITLKSQFLIRLQKSSWHKSFSTFRKKATPVD